MTASDHVRVVLDSVQTKLTGTYLCEVLTKFYQKELYFTVLFTKLF